MAGNNNNNNLERDASQGITDACTPPDGEASGKALLAARGKCSFIDKAEAVRGGPGEATAAAALIIVNNETSLFHMGAHPRYGWCRRDC